MAETSFQIPQMNEAGETPELIAAIKSSFIDVEAEELLRPYAFVKGIEAEIHDMHSKVSPMDFEDRIDYEGDLGGALLGNEESRKNLEARHSRVDRARRALARVLALSPNIPAPVVVRFWFLDGDWYYEVNDAVGRMVARYQFTDNDAIKLVEGVPTPFVKDDARGIDEKANLLKMIPLFHEAVLKEQSKQSDFDLAA